MSKHDKVYAKFTSTLLLLCFGAALFQVLFAGVSSNPNLVYCPLQNKWVKSGEETILAVKDFDDFCATAKRKEFIKAKIHFKTRFSPVITENLVFDYLEKGNQIFSLANHLPEIPPREFIRKSLTITAGSNFFDYSIKLATGKFSLKQAARPPTFSAQARFSFQFVRSLSAISRNINPRSPPIFI